MDESLKSSQLIGKLVNYLRPNDTKALEMSVNIMRKYTNKPILFSSSEYKTKWTTKLNSEGNNSKIMKLQRAISKISQKTKKSDLLFSFFDHLITETVSTIYIEDTPAPSYKLQLNLIPHDVINVLQGFDGDKFKWNHKSDRFMYNGNVMPSLVQVIRRVSEIGSTVRFLRNFEQRTLSLIFQNAFNYVKEIIDEHCANVISLGCKIDKLSTNEFLDLINSPIIDKLKASAIICNTTFGLKGGFYYNKLNSLSNHGDLEIKTVSKIMYDLSFNMINNMVREWISRGVIIDQYDEFFIKKNEDVNFCSDWWDRQYSLITSEAPLCFNSSQIQMIFDSGKILNFLRRWDHPVEINVDTSLPLNEYIVKCSEATEKLIIDLMYAKNLKSNIHHIYSYLLLGRGDFANSFMAIDDDAKHIQLHRIAYEIAKQPIEGFDFVVRDGSWSFAYHISPPLSLLLNSKVMAVYKAVSTQLLHLKKAEYKILRCREQFKSETEYCTTIFRMIHFINLVSDFFHQEVIQKSFTKLEKSIEKSTKISEIMKHLEKHCAEIARGCWASNSGKECSAALRKVLSTIEDVVDSDKTLEQSVEEFSNAIIDFKAKCTQNKTGASELVRPLTRIFSNFLVE